MNQPIVRLYGLVVLLFALLVAFTSRWTIFEATSLRENRLNKRRMLLEQQRIDRGPDRRRRRHRARAQPSAGPKGVYERTYPTGEPVRQRDRLLLSPTAAAPGWSASATARSTARRDTGLQSDPRPAPGQASRAGTKVVTTLDPQRAAGRRAQRSPATHGAVVALEPRTGAVTVMASSPELSTRTPLGSTAALRSGWHARSTRASRWSTARPQFGYAPGSTFKVVTATAAIDTGAFTPAIDPQRPQRHPDLRASRSQNDENESFGQITLTRRARPFGQHRLGAGRRAGSASRRWPAT